MTKLQPIVKWSSSKRSQAEEIIKHFPKEIETYYEPFCGGCSVLWALLKNLPGRKVKYFVCSDVNRDLIDLWDAIKFRPVNNPCLKAGA